MLSYRHAFHAGNHADVLKHLVLHFCLKYLNKKNTAYLYLDTHAGAGTYKLDESYAAMNKEWQSGISRLLSIQNTRAETNQPEAIHEYLHLVQRFYDTDCSYPGSPLVAASLMRKQDRAVLCELHPADFSVLESLFSTDKRIKSIKQDGLHNLKAQLPPPSRRACIMIDPSYECKEDYEMLPLALSQALKRFPSGVYICWFPLLPQRDITAYSTTLYSLYQKSTALCTLQVKAAPNDKHGMYGSGLCIYNPPWTLKAMLEECLPYLVQHLGDDKAFFSLLWK